MSRAKSFATAGCSAALVLLSSFEALGDEAILRVPVSLPVHKDGKKIGETKIPQGARITVMEIRDGMALVSRAPAEPVWIGKDKLVFALGGEPAQSPEEKKTATQPPAEPARSGLVAERLTQVAASIAAAGRKFSEWVSAHGEGSGSRNMSPTSDADRGEKRTDVSVPATADEAVARSEGVPVLRLWVDREKQKPGLEGTYFNQRLGDRSKGDLTLVARGTRRTDEAIDFGPRDWGNRRRMRITGGDQSTWRDFTVQWEGWAELDHPGRLTLLASGGSRMWIDAGGDGEFSDDPSELIDNEWGSSRHHSLAASAVLPAGLYRIRIQYEGNTGENSVRLAATDGFVDYSDFNGDPLRLFLWLGREVALLTRSGDHDPAAMADIVEWYDKAHEYFVRVTGRKPSKHYSLSGRNTIAEVPRTCGMGCGMVGATGVEMTKEAFAKLSRLFREEGAIYSLPLYELGRNFYFYGEQLGYQAPDYLDVGSAFALVMQSLCYLDAGLPAPREMREYDKKLVGILDAYLADPNRRFDNTLRENKSNELLAAMILRLHRDYGGEEFITRFWQGVARQDKAGSTQEAVDNFVRAACLAAGRNLTELFAGPWKLPVSDSLENEMKGKFGLPSS